jgi:plasmid replication initiation protein
VAKADHKEGSGIVKIQFSPDVQKMLFQLKGEWSAAVAVEIASCQTSYGPMLYDKFMSHRRFGKWEVSVKDLRFELGIENKYKNFADFRRYVLKKAQKDLQRNTNMRFTWEEQKNARGRGKGRKITHIKFDFSWKPNQMNLPMEESKKKSTFDIYGLRERLKRDAQLEQKQIERVLKFLKKNEEKREQFKDDFAPISDALQQGVDFDNNVLKKPSSWAWPKIEPLIEN